MTLPDDARSYERERLSGHASSEANLFFLIVVLSIVNEALLRSGKAIYFVAGLATTWLAAAFAHNHAPALGSHAEAAGYALAALPLAALVALGFFARKGHVWAYATGTALYAADGAAFLMLFHDYFSAGFHAFVLYFLVSGLIAAFGARGLRAPAPLEPEPVVEPHVDNKPSGNSLYPRS